MYTISNAEKINKTKVVRHILEDRFQKLQACMFSDVFVGEAPTTSRVFKIKQGSRGRRPRRPAGKCAAFFEPILSAIPTNQQCEVRQTQIGWILEGIYISSYFLKQ